MSGQSIGQARSGTADPVLVKPPRVSADSFRLLTQRLKAAPPQQSEPAVPVVTKGPVESPDPSPAGPIADVAAPSTLAVEQQATAELPSVAAQITDQEVVGSADSLAENANHHPIHEASEVIPSEITGPIRAEIPTPHTEANETDLLAAEPESPTSHEAPLAEPAILQPQPAEQAEPPQVQFAVRSLPPILAAPPVIPAAPVAAETAIEELDTSAILSDRIERVLAKTAAEALPSEQITLPPILPPPEPLKSPPPKPTVEMNIDVINELHRINAEVKRRRDSELENIVRLVFAIPSLEERAQYLEEAALLAQMERAQQMVNAQPADDLEALAMEHISKFSADEHEDAGETVSFAADISDVQQPPQAASEEADTISAARVSSEEPETFIPVPDVQEAESVSHPVSEETTPQQIEQPPPQQKQRKLSRRSGQSEPQGSVHAAVQNMSEQQVSDLARSLLDMMASGSSAGLPQERALAADTLLRILPRLPQRALVQLSERLAMMEHPPHLIVGKILQDPRIDVSGPLIENGVNIGERELIGLVETGDVAKLRLVARRRRLSRAITTMLIESCNPSVLLTLVRNAHAELAHESFVALTDFAKDEPDLLAPLCTRADLPAPQAFELFWLAPPQLRRYLLSRFLTDSETLTKILKITLATQGGELAADSSVDPAQCLAALQKLEAGDHDEAVELLSELTRVGAETVTRILEDSSGEPLVVLLKILALPRTELQGELQKLQKTPDVMLDPDRDLDELQALFDTLSYNKARILLTYWDWATQGTGPYAPSN